MRLLLTQATIEVATLECIEYVARAGRPHGSWVGLVADRAWARVGGARVGDGDASLMDVDGSPLSSTTKVRLDPGVAIEFYETRAMAEEPAMLSIGNRMLCYCRVLRPASRGSVIARR